MYFFYKFFIFLTLFLVSVSYGEGVVLKKQSGGFVGQHTLRTDQYVFKSMPTLNLEAVSYVLMDADTGKVLKSFEEHKQIYPASLTKVLTLYLVASALQNEQISLNDLVPISEKAWRTGGSKMFVKVGSLVKMEDLVRGIATVSGNDAAVAVAEYLGGNEENFAEMMNTKAAELGMVNSHFVNASGLPRPDHYSTALDLAKLTHSWFKNIPEFYFWFKEKWLDYNGIKQPNRNRLLWQYDWVDGVKTGHTEEAGYCLISSGIRDNLRLIGVIIGAPKEIIRNRDALALLNFGFRNFKRQLILEKNKEAGKIRIFGGKSNYLKVGTVKDWYVTLPKLKGEVKTMFNIKKSLYAPINVGEVCGSVTVLFNDEVIDETELISLDSIAKGNVFKRVIDYFRVK